MVSLTATLLLLLVVYVWCNSLTRPFSRPHIVGYDVSGVVTACGADVTKFRVGDAVFGMMPHDRNGALAEYEPAAVDSVWLGGLCVVILLTRRRYVTLILILFLVVVVVVMVSDSPLCMKTAWLRSRRTSRTHRTAASFD